MTDEVNDKSILVIEDNELNLKLVRNLIQINNYRIMEASNAEDGIEMARMNKPDLILMDIELPGIDGFDATRMIRDDPGLRDVPVLALTAFAMKDDMAKAQAVGFSGYITKPISIKSFQEIIDSHLSESRDTSGCSIRAYGKRILIVDDEALNLKLLSALLTSKGYQVATACDGQSALRLVATDHPDLILLDIMMPGLDGYEVTARLKAEPDTRDIPIILVTALTGEDEKKKGLEAGADEFINKPVNYAELEARVFSLLRLKEYQDQLGTRIKSENYMVQGIACIENPVEAGNADNGLPTVLVVEDDSTSAKLMMKYLSVMQCKIKMAKNGEDALQIASTNKIDIMLLDIMLPSMDGFEVCKAIKDNEETIAIQVVMITSLTDTASKLKGIEVGTDDFLVKPVNKDEFRARIKSLFKKKAYLDKLRAKVDKALHAAITDRLTGVYNHGYFMHFIDLEIKRSKRHNHDFALLMIDVDDFKIFNDKYGHQCGDQALRMIADILKANVRDIDVVARYGGEEFAVSLPYACKNVAESIANRLLKSVVDHKDMQTAPGARLSVSIGISLFPVISESPEDLIRTADMALYSAKRGGKNQFCTFSSQPQRDAIKELHA